MRLESVSSEALRNLMSGTVRSVVLLLIFLASSGGIAMTAMGSVAGVLQESREFANSGATVTIITAPESVSGESCRRLAGAPRVRAAGAIAEASPVVFSKLPSSPVPAKRVTDGFHRLFAARADSGVAGVFLSREAASVLGLDVGDSAKTSRGTVRVAGIYEFPADGRIAGLGYAVLIPESDTGHVRFDECWIDVPHPANETRSLLWTAILLPADSSESPSFAQLNSSRGVIFDGAARVAALPITALNWAACLSGFAIGAAATRLRRLELVSALHCGISREALVLQTVIESLLWLVPGAVIAAGGLGLVSQGELTEDVSAVFAFGFRAVILSAIGVVVGTATAAWMNREHHLFKYFKER